MGIGRILAGPAHLPDLNPQALGRCGLRDQLSVGCLISGLCSSGRGFAPRFLQTPRRGDAFWDRSGNQRQFRSSGERRQQRLVPWSLPTESEQNRLLLCFVPPKSDAVRNLVPRFDRASNRSPDLPLSSLAVGHEPPSGCSLSVPCAARLWRASVCRTEARGSLPVSGHEPAPARTGPVPGYRRGQCRR